MISGLNLERKKKSDHLNSHPHTANGRGAEDWLEKNSVGRKTLDLAEVVLVSNIFKSDFNCKMINCSLWEKLKI